MDMMQSIIKREFEAASGFTVKAVEFNEDESILVVTSAMAFRMDVGSDDDEFRFVETSNGHEVSFAYPADWLDAIDENNFS
jgi:hypothetical protein